jgi:DNA repair protein RecO (recombination protein O)
LLSGYYLNELLLTLLARDDPHPLLFDIYSAVVRVIASEHGEVLQAALRTYELLLLREIGLLPQLDLQTMTLQPLEEAVRYQLVPEGGLRLCGPDERSGLTGAQWSELQAALQDSAPFTTTLRTCAQMMSGLKPQLRNLLHYHCGVKTLRSRQMMIDIQNL